MNLNLDLKLIAGSILLSGVAALLLLKLGVLFTLLIILSICAGSKLIDASQREANYRHLQDHLKPRVKL